MINYKTQMENKDDRPVGAFLVIGNFLLVFLGVFCAFGAFISAFEFTVDFALLFALWMATSLFAVLLIYFKQAKALLLLLVMIIILLLWRFHDILEGAKWVFFTVSNDFSNWLFIQVLFIEANATAAQQTLFFLIAGMLLTLPIAIAVYRRRSLLLTVLFTLPLVLFVFVSVYSQPSPLFLVGLLAVYFSLLLRRADYPLPHFLSIFLVIILLGSAFIIVPQRDFARNNSVKAMEHYLRSFALRTGIIKIKPGVGWPAVNGDLWGFDTDYMGISGAGKREVADIDLLEVTVGKAGVFYLKGYSMQRFDGSSWTVNSDESPVPDEPWISVIPTQIAEAYYLLNSDSAINHSSMIISGKGDSTEDIIYKPYYSYTISQYQDSGFYVFFYPEESITVLYDRLTPEAIPGFDLSSYSARVHSRDTYLQIDDSTSAGLRQFAEDAGFDLTGDRAKIVSQVALYFSSFGQYTLSPLIVPEDEDFALYFLQSSRHGYCIHYATAATMLLRALDVPARIAVGFVVSVSHDEVNQPLIITDGNAHAWVEVFFDNTGWLPLEVTPPAGGYSEGGLLSGVQYADAADLPDLSPTEDRFGEDFTDPWDTRGVIEAGMGEVPPGEQYPWRENVLKSAFVALITGLLSLVIRRIVILYLRKRRFMQVNANAAAIDAWCFITKLIGPQRQNHLSKGIKELVYKARFSQHLLTEKERGMVVSYAYVTADGIYEQSNVFKRLVIKYISGL